MKFGNVKNGPYNETGIMATLLGGNRLGEFDFLIEK
jgi:hypothetical protein